MTTASGIGTPGCQLVTEGEQSKRYCVLATEVALIRKTLLDEVASLAGDATAALEHSNSDAARFILSKITERATAEDALTEVSDGEVVIAITRALEGVVSAEPSALVEQAFAVRDFIARGGWVIVRSDGCLS